MGGDMERPASLAATACQVLRTADPSEKAAQSLNFVAAWQRGEIAEIGDERPPDRPSRPDEPPLRAPRELAKRKITQAPAGRIALLHALAHIELNAIDLAWDIVARFAMPSLPRSFYDDWLRVAGEEAKHYSLLAARLEALGSHYGALPAHDGLWQAAQDTAGDLLARLAVVPLVLEARGLDVTPAMIARLKAVGDDESAAVLEIIYHDEIGHVAIGRRWFLWACEARGLEPRTAWAGLVQRHFKGQLKPPFNEAGRRQAGLEPEDYLPLVAAN